MSDPYGSFDSPYGDAPFAGQKPPWPPQPPPYPQPSYGRPPYGRHPDKRPGTVTAAAVITIVLSSLTAIVFLILAIVCLANRDWFRDNLADRSQFDSLDPDDVLNLLVGVSVVYVAISVLAIVMAILVLRRSTVARVVLVVLSAVTIVMSLLAIGSGISLVTLVAAILVIVFLFSGGANDWFRKTRIVPYGQPWG